jgi:hypothetical protein
MNAPAHLPQLPLGHGEPSQPLPAIAEGETAPTQSYHPDYVRLFGSHPPEQVMGIPSPALCDPTQAAECSPSSSEAIGHHECHLSDALFSVGQLRSNQFAKGYTLDRDLARGPAWFWHGIHHFWWLAMDEAKNRDKRRKAKVAAAALLIASIEADDFHAQQESAQ